MGNSIVYENITEYKIYKKRNIRFRRNDNVKKLESASYVHSLLVKIYGHDIDVVEKFSLILLDVSLNIKGIVILSSGTTDATLVDLKMIGKYIVDTLSSNVIIAHNHPSGNLTTSEEDKTITKKVKEICELFNAKLLDSIIFTKNNYKSIIHYV